MFSQQVCRNARLATHVVKRFARPSQSRGYATGGKLTPHHARTYLHAQHEMLTDFVYSSSGSGR
jgi:hypothetical protein